MRCAATLALVACGSSSTPVPIGTRVGPAVSAALEAADAARAPWRCASADGPSLRDETLKVGSHAWHLGGHAMTFDGTGAITIGVIADAGGAAPTTIAALGRLHARFATADLVIALGGMGTTQAELEATLGTIAAAAPVVALPGDLESVAAQTAAIAALRARNRSVIDGRLVHAIELPGATIAILPGAGAMARLVAGADGCGFAPADASRVLAALAARPGLRILAVAEAPRITANGEAAGELVVPASIDVVVHGPVIEAGSPPRSGSRDGSAVAITPGTSDATTRLPGPRHIPSVGLLTITGNTWRWRPISDE